MFLGCSGSGPAVGEERQLRETSDPGIVLSVLSSIERDGAITHRQLARELGIVLGLTNAYLRRCVRKGLVKMSAGSHSTVMPITWRRKGFAEKSRLTGEYLAYPLDFFRRARNDCAALFRHCEALGWRNVALYGASDLAGIAILSAGETTVEVRCVIDAGAHGRRCGGRPIVADLAAAIKDDVRPIDAIILTDTRAPQASFDALLAMARRNGLSSIQFSPRVPCAFRRLRHPSKRRRRRSDALVRRLHPSHTPRRKRRSIFCARGILLICRATVPGAAMRGGGRRCCGRLFPRYLFAGVDRSWMPWRPILSTVGVTDVVRAGEEPTAVPPEVLAAIREREELGAFDRLDPRQSMSLGNQVRVTAGGFGDMVGRLVELRDHDRVVGLLELLGRAVRSIARRGR
jgi:transcription antitermination factor NusG